MPSSPDAPPRPDRRARRWSHVVLGLIAYVPLLATDPGWIAADTKTYLYLDPGRLMGRATSMWDPNVALGTVTHQTIGYLWPMGPWYWVLDHLGAPDWVAQRLWMATLLFAAGAGMLYLARTLGWGRVAPGAALAAALLYALSPYVLDYVARISVLLLPWAALPWLVALVQRALQTGSWRHPAAFSLLVVTAGSVNATALVFAGVGPLLWLVFAVVVHREATVRRALATAGRIAVLALPLNLWWMIGLGIQGRWGLDVLKFTETIETVSRNGIASEVLRGLGYWFFYGTDKLGPWIEPSRTFTQNPWLIALTFALPVLALATTLALGWRYRAFAVTMIAVGTSIAVGAYPYDDPSPLGRLFKDFANSSTAGLALRSTPRAVPLLVLGMTLLVGAGLAALAARGWRHAGRAAFAVGVLAVLANPALWTGQFVDKNLRRREDIPDYWKQAADHLDSEGDDTRALEVPGSDFASYRWGNTVDPITPGIMDRPYAARELVPFGTAPSSDLMIAFDRRMQEGVLDPSAVAPFAQLVSAGDVVLRGDLQYERYRLARPATVRQTLDSSTLGTRTDFGTPTVNEADPNLPMHDEIWFQNQGHDRIAPVSTYHVPNTMPIVHTRAAKGAVVLSGDGEGVVEAGSAGLLDGTGALLLSGDLAGRPGVLDQALTSGASLVVTDTNRQRAERWGNLRDNDGYTERPDEKPLRVDSSDNRLPLFPDAGEDARTTVEQRGVARVEATSYGHPVSYTASQRPANAFDGNVDTAWGVGTSRPVQGERILVQANAPVTTSSVNVVQARFGPRTIQRVGVVLDGKRVGSFTLDDRSFAAAGQTLDLGRARTFTTLELVIEGDSVGRVGNYDSQNAVGFSEVRAAGLHVDEVVKLPQDLLDKATNDQPLTLLMARERANPAEPFVQDEELTMQRTFTLPTARTFTVTGSARVQQRIPDDRLDDLLGGVGTLVGRSSGRMPGEVAVRASAALDGNPATYWENGFGDQPGAWLEVDLGRPQTTDHLALQVVADGSHSVPTSVVLTDERGEQRTVTVPAITDGTTAGHVVTVDLRFPALTGQTLRLTVDQVRPVTTIDWFTQQPIQMPVAIAELGVTAPQTRRPAATAPWSCRNDLLTVDGRPVWLQVTPDGTAGEQNGLSVRTCGADANGVALTAGTHDVRAAQGLATGFDLDRLVLGSAKGGTAAASPPAVPTGPTSTGQVRVLEQGRTSMRVEVDADEPTWLVLGESQSDGWTATVAGHSLGTPVLLDGFANGWLIQPDGKGPVVVELNWTPQRTVRAGLTISGLTALLCLAIVVVGWRRRPSWALDGAPMPTLRSQWWRTGPAASWAVVALASITTGVAAGALVEPVVGLGIGAFTVVALRSRWARVLGVGGVASVAAAGMYTAAKQLRNHYVTDFGWTDFFRPAHLLAWVGLLVVAVVVLVDALRRRPDDS